LRLEQGIASRQEIVNETEIGPGDLIVGQWDTPARVVNRSAVSGNRQLIRLATDAGVMEVLPGSVITRIIED
jgi:hypothetical protein